jgi:hypothetical protein
MVMDPYELLIICSKLLMESDPHTRTYMSWDYYCSILSTTMAIGKLVEHYFLGL